MIYYELKIESSDGTIEIKENNTIYFAEVALNTINEKTQQKSNAILATVTLRGEIKSTINDSLIKISEWARDLKKETTYRKVTLTIKEDEVGSILRTYEIPLMFVCHYREIYDGPEGDKQGIFELKLTQKETCLKDFNTY